MTGFTCEQVGSNLGVQGTPSIFINGKEYQGERNIASLIEATEKALAGAVLMHKVDQELDIIHRRLWNDAVT